MDTVVCQKTIRVKNVTNNANPDRSGKLSNNRSETCNPSPANPTKWSNTLKQFDKKPKVSGVFRRYKMVVFARNRLHLMYKCSNFFSTKANLWKK